MFNARAVARHVALARARCLGNIADIDKRTRGKLIKGLTGLGTGALHTHTCGKRPAVIGAAIQMNGVLSSLPCKRGEGDLHKDCELSWAEPNKGLNQCVTLNSKAGS